MARVVLVVVALGFLHCSTTASEATRNHSKNNVDRHCPTWQYYDIKTERCKCGSDIHGAVECNDTTNEVRLLDCYCMSMNHEGRMEVGKCFIGCAHSHSHSRDKIYNQVPQNKAEVNSWMCAGLNKNGSFCGKCRTGFSPLVYSYDISCQKCTLDQTQNIFAFIAAAFGPLTLFYILVVVFKVSATSPHLFSFVTFSQWMAEPINVRTALHVVQRHPRFQLMTRFIASAYGIWNLDFFRTLYPPICLNVSKALILALDYLPAFYILILILFTYLLIKLHSYNFRVLAFLRKPIEHLVTLSEKLQTGSSNSSLVNVFSTFFLLSYIKILSVSFTLLVPTTLYDVYGNRSSTVLYYDASVPYAGEEHLPYAVIAVTVLLVFIIAPLLFLTLYPYRWFQRCLNFCRIRSQAIHIFADCYLGWLKNGTERGERDCRFITSFYLSLRIGILCIYIASRTVYAYAVIAGALVVFSMIHLIARPYKAKWDTYNKVDPCAMMLLALWCITALGINIATEKDFDLVYPSAVLCFIVAVFPLVCMMCVLLFKLLRKSHTLVQWVGILKRKMRFRNIDYDALDGFDGVDIPAVN